MLALSISAVDKSFRAGALGCSALVRVLRGVGLAIWSGEMVALEGARSSGKTTVLRCAAGLLRPDAGNIRWFGAHVAPPNAVWYAGAGAPDARDARVHGALHARLECVLERGARLLLLDDLDAVGGLERRLILHLLAEHVARGGAALVASRLGLDSESPASRVVTLADGAIVQRRKRSATRIAASSFASRARSSARSTYGRSFRSPQ
jgi:ABC-type cobalamin/Fe3+-siderophores transport system ATPase subunit